MRPVGSPRFTVHSLTGYLVGYQAALGERREASGHFGGVHGGGGHPHRAMETVWYVVDHAYAHRDLAEYRGLGAQAAADDHAARLNRRYGPWPSEAEEGVAA